METINLSTDEETSYNDFKDGNPVQVRVTVPPSEERKYSKGTTVNIARGDFHAKGKIVSDPLVIGAPLEGQDRTLSLIIEKA
jgi:hypothetical protein